MPLSSLPSRPSLLRNCHCRAAAAFLAATLLPLLSRCRCLHHHNAALFIAITMQLSSLLHHRCLHCRHDAAVFITAPLLPSSPCSRCLHIHDAALFIAVTSPLRRCHRRATAASAPPLPSPRRRCLSCRNATTFTVTPPLPPSSLRCSLHHRHAATASIVTTPLSSLPSRCSCLHCRAAAAFIAAMPLPSPSRCRCLQSRRCLHHSLPLHRCLNCQAAAAFLVAGNRTSDNYTMLSL
jgi:hypothetical protein